MKIRLGPTVQFRLHRNFSTQKWHPKAVLEKKITIKKAANSYLMCFSLFWGPVYLPKAAGTAVRSWKLPLCAGCLRTGFSWIVIIFNVLVRRIPELINKPGFSSHCCPKSFRYPIDIYIYVHIHVYVRSLTKMPEMPRVMWAPICTSSSSVCCKPRHVEMAQKI